MNKQEKFYDLPTEPPPRNRRVYAAAKAPFGYLWEFLGWASKPWLYALPLAMLASVVVNLIANGLPSLGGLMQFAGDSVTVGLLWTVYLGAVFAVLKVLQAIFE
ncbi:hypothetical protein [Burkholderia ubonensis]|uniref:hypothetical protein n=1 Tax=Burkholderia ubonensis TaxID=101571 RepID=UPI00075D4901|nr:hypothetical protein [Burkholderia ubonensis]KVP16797.1 hypothetical protein WJ84_00555 [Burkholderia ubonensis]